MWEILEVRDRKPFASFADLKERVKLMPDPEKAIIKRILAELAGTEKHNVFVDV
jgi:putative nucleotide binding protein